MTDERRRTLRTFLQTAVGLAVALPDLIHTTGLPDTAPGVAKALAASTILARIMAAPAVNRWLPTWLRAAADPDDAAHRRAVRE